VVVFRNETLIFEIVRIFPVLDILLQSSAHCHLHTTDNDNVWLGGDRAIEYACERLPSKHRFCIINVRNVFATTLSFLASQGCLPRKL